MLKKAKILMAALSMTLSAGAAHSALMGFDIILNNTGGPLSAADQAAFTAAEATWESIIGGYQDNVATNTLTINFSVSPIDGPGGILGQAGPTGVKAPAPTFVYADTGIMTFDSADTPGLGAALNDVILHEMGHVLGIGTLWTNNGLYVNGTGQYTGAAGLAAYNSEFNQAGAFVPVELGGGPGTANAHWNETDGGAGPTGIVSNITGRDMQEELMTGWLNAPPTSFISSLTTASLFDLGYILASAGGGVPIVPVWALLILGLLVMRRRTGAHA